MPVFEVTSRVTRRALMNRTKDELATRVLDLMDGVEWQRARREDEATRAKAAEDALVGFTPDGSEFYRKNPDRFAEREFLVDVPACVAHIRDARDRMREGIVEANRSRNEAVTELRSARFRNEQATRCAGCGERKHTPLRVDAMEGYVCLTCIDKRLHELLAKEADPATITLTPGELRNLLEVSWRDGNGLPERWHDEWPETMHANVKQTLAEIDRWKVEGVSKDSYPEESRCPCGMPYADCLEGSVRDRRLTEEECPRYGS